jgi:hypothetical protein
MRKTLIAPLLLTGTLLLSACGSSGLFNRDRPDEFAVSRQPPLVIPPDFALAPPAAGTAASQQSTTQQQAIDAMFGGPAPRSSGETSALESAGRQMAAIGIRSEVGSPETRVMDKGRVVQDIIAAPEGDGQFARAVAGGR